MSVETDADEVAESTTVQESSDSTRLSVCNSARGTRVLHKCRMAQRGVQQCETQGVVTATQSPVEGALVSGRGSFSNRSVSSLTGMSEVGWISYFSVIELQCSSNMQHDERGMQCRCSAGSMDQQQHECKGSCCTDATVAVAGPWAAVQDAAVQRMMGSKPASTQGPMPDDQGDTQ